MNIYFLWTVNYMLNMGDDVILRSYLSVLGN